MHTHARIIVALLSVSAVSCGPPVEDFSLRPDEAERLRERRSRMNINVSQQGVASEMTPDEFLAEVVPDCEAAAELEWGRLHDPDGRPAIARADMCLRRLCFVVRHLPGESLSRTCGGDSSC